MKTFDGLRIKFTSILAVNMDKGCAPEHLRSEANGGSKVGIEIIENIHRLSLFNTWEGILFITCGIKNNFSLTGLDNIPFKE